MENIVKSYNTNNNIIEIVRLKYKNHTVYGVKGTGETYEKFFTVLNEFKYTFLPNRQSFWEYILFENDTNHENFQNHEFIKTLEIDILTFELEQYVDKEISKTELIEFKESDWT